jgi:hypothetical protein
MLKYVIYYLNETYYTPLLLLLMQILTLTISIKFRKNNSTLKFLPIYLSLSLIQNLIFFASMLRFAHSTRAMLYTLNEYAIFLFTIIETMIFTLLYNRSFSHRRRIFNAILLGILAFYSFYLMMRDHTTTNLLTTMYFTESTILTLQCISYFTTVFKSPHTLTLSRDPLFWMSIGLSFVVLGMISFNLMHNYLTHEYPTTLERLQTIVYITYCIFFGTIIKAYLCNRGTSKEYF